MGSGERTDGIHVRWRCYFAMWREETSHRIRSVL